MGRIRVPSYRSHRPSGQAVVSLNGRDFYLGPHGTEASKRQYDRLVAEWAANGRRLPSTEDDGPAVAEIIASFLKYAATCYVDPEGRPTGEADTCTLALRPLRELYGRTPAREFSPRCLRAVQQAMIQRGWTRTGINKQINRIKSMFKWAVSREMVPPETWQALQAVPALKRGRSQARESEPVRPVPPAMVQAVLPHLPGPVRALVELQLLTGARPGELLELRPGDIDRTQTVWTYKPVDHKNEWRGHARTIYFGPQSQRIVTPYLLRSPHKPCFSPAEAEARRRAALHAKRTTPMSCGNKPGSNVRDEPERRPGDRYNEDAYRNAIQRACLRVHPPPARLRRQKEETPEDYQKRMGGPDGAALRAWRQAHCWHPHQLRHNAATRLRREFGIDLAQTILGHRLGSAVTEIYAEANVAKAVEVVARIG